MISYDEKLLYKFAEKMYRSAMVVIVFLSLLGTVLGGAIARVLWTGQNAAPWVVILGIVGLSVGFMIGQSIAFWLRLKAQLVLCQAATEENTRTLARSWSQSGRIIQPDGIGEPSRGDTPLGSKDQFSGAGNNPSVQKLSDKPTATASARFESQVHERGKAFCLGCRTVDEKAVLILDLYERVYYHEGCIPREKLT